MPTLPTWLTPVLKWGGLALAVLMAAILIVVKFLTKAPEAGAMPGTGKLTITGQLGDVMKESARIALSWVRAHASDLDIDSDSLDDGTVATSSQIRTVSMMLPGDTGEGAPARIDVYNA